MRSGTENKRRKPPKSKAFADEGNQTLPQPAVRSSPDTRKRVREPTASPEVSAAKKTSREEAYSLQ